MKAKKIGKSLLLGDPSDTRCLRGGFPDRHAVTHETLPCRGVCEPDADLFHTRNPVPIHTAIPAMSAAAKGKTVMRISCPMRLKPKE